MQTTAKFEQILAAIASRLGLSRTVSGVNRLPDNQPAVIAKLMEAVNFAGRKVYGAHEWTWKRAPHQLDVSPTGTDSFSIDNSTTNYYLPADIQGPADEHAWWGASGLSGRGVPRVAEMFVLRALAEQPGRSGPPEWIGFKSTPSTENLSSRPQKTIVIFPKPDQLYTLYIPVKRKFVDLVDMQEQPQWDETLDTAVIHLACAYFVGSGEVPSKLNADAEEAKGNEILATQIKADQDEAGGVTGSLIPNRRATTVLMGNVTLTDGTVIIPALVT